MTVRRISARMLSRGIITLRQLRILMFPTIILESILSFYLGLTQGISLDNDFYMDGIDVKRVFCT